MEITLDMLLASRDRRHLRQMAILDKYPDKTLMCLTVVMPGKVKRNQESLTVAHKAMETLRSVAPPLNILYELDLETGYEAYALADMSVAQAKTLACNIEESHPLGRLFDIDIIDKNGTPISRQSVGIAPRQCLICNNEARYCMRNHTHTQEEIQERIRQIISESLKASEQ